MHHRITYMYMNFQQNRVSRSVETWFVDQSKRAHLFICKKNGKLHKFELPIVILKKINSFRHASS